MGSDSQTALTVKRRSGSLMLKTAHDAEEVMRTGARVSPSWPGGDFRGQIRCSRVISRRSQQPPLQPRRAIRFNSLLNTLGEGPGATYGGPQAPFAGPRPTM